MLNALFLQADLGLFIGRFHPLVVHLPIGFLLLAGILEYIKRKKQLEGWDGAINLSLFLGALGGLIAIICGWLLAAEGGYQEGGLAWHRWMGILTTLLAGMAWLIRVKRIPMGPKSFTWVLSLSILGLVVTGHLGGNLTHGQGYLFQYAPGFIQTLVGHKADTVAIGSFPSPDSILVFADLIRPVMEKKCWSCHGGSKTQGGLSMVTMAALMEGGDHGAVIEEGSPISSELIRRVTIDPSSVKFMPPKGSPMTFTEINLLSWWIEAGADSSLHLTDTEVPDHLKALLLRDYKLDTRPRPYVETASTEPMLPEVRSSLENAGFLVQLLAANSNFVEISPKEVQSTVTSDQIQALAGGKKQITWLNLGGTDIKDEDLEIIGQLGQLTRLRLEKNQITDQGIAHLSGLQHLESLNLYATQVTDSCLDHLAGLPALKKLYLWQTQVTADGIEQFKSKRPEMMIDTGFQFAQQN